MPTDYIILRQARSAEAPEDKTKGWLVVAEGVQAVSAEAAIRQTVSDLNPADGAYVATPQRSWKPLTVTATTQTIIKFG